MIDNDDDQPYFRVCFQGKDLFESKEYFWTEYNRLSRTWSRICLECRENVCDMSMYFCQFHFNKENNKKKKQSKPTKRIQRKTKLTLYNSILNENTSLINESHGFVLSISSSINKKQIVLIKEFIEKFHRDSLPIYFTCESQPDYIDETTTHLITNNIGSSSTNLTKQILQACVRHIFIGSIDWIISSLEQSSLLDHFPFEILREKHSPRTNRGIKQCRFDHLPLFPSSYIFSLEYFQTIKHLQLTRDDLIELIELAGGTLVNNSIKSERIFMISNRKLSTIVNDEKLVFCKADFLFHSIVRHEIQAIDNYLCPKIDFQQFPYLRSLILDTNLTIEQINSIQPKILPLLQRLTLTYTWKDQEDFHQRIFNKNIQLKQWIKVYHLPSISNDFLVYSKNFSFIQTMIFDRMTLIDVHIILSLQLNLKRLKITVVSSIADEKFSKFSLVNLNYQHQYLIDFHITMNTYNKIDDLYSLLSHLSVLKYLYIACDSLVYQDFKQLSIELKNCVPFLKNFNCTFKQTYIDDMKKIHCLNPLFSRMKLKTIQWIGGWHYYCITTENV